MDQNEQDMIYIDGSDFNLSSMSDFLLKISMSRTVWCNMKNYPGLKMFKNASKCWKWLKMLKNGLNLSTSLKIAYIGLNNP